MRPNPLETFAEEIFNRKLDLCAVIIPNVIPLFWWNMALYNNEYKTWKHVHSENIYGNVSLIFW